MLFRCGKLPTRDEDNHYFLLLVDVMKSDSIQAEHSHYWELLLDNYQYWFCCFLSWLGHTVFCMLPVYVSVYRPGHEILDTADFRMRRKSTRCTLRKTIRPVTYRGHVSMFTADFRHRRKSKRGTLRKNIRPVTCITSKTADFRTRRKSYACW